LRCTRTLYIVLPVFVVYISMLAIGCPSP